MNAALPETFDPADDLSRYTTAQLRIIAGYLEPEILRIFNDSALVDSMTDADKRKTLDAVEYLNRTSAEILRRDALPSAGPTAVHYETMPDGSDPIRFSSTVLAF